MKDLILAFLSDPAHWQIFSYFVSGFVFSVFITVSGIGAGSLLVPFLIIVYKENALTAIGTAGLFSFGAKIFASILHIYLRNVSYSIFAFFSLGTIPAILLTLSILNLSISYGYEKRISFFSELMITFVLFFAIVTMLSREGRKKHLIEGKKHFAFFGSLLGVVMSLTGVGAGIVMIPLLKKTTKIDLKKIIGTSVLTACLSSLTIGLMYSKSQDINYKAIAFMLCGTIAAFPFNKFFIQKIPNKLLRYLIVSLLILSIIMITAQRHF